MERKTNQERTSAIEEPSRKLAERKKKILKEEKAKMGKARNHRLIERGAIVESYIDGLDKYYHKFSI